MNRFEVLTEEHRDVLWRRSVFCTHHYKISIWRGCDVFKSKVPPRRRNNFYIPFLKLKAISANAILNSSFDCLTKVFFVCLGSNLSSFVLLLSRVRPWSRTCPPRMSGSRVNKRMAFAIHTSIRPWRIFPCAIFDHKRKEKLTKWRFYFYEFLVRL